MKLNKSVIDKWSMHSQLSKKTILIAVLTENQAQINDETAASCDYMLQY